MRITLAWIELAVCFGCICNLGNRHSKTTGPNGMGNHHCRVSHFRVFRVIQFTHHLDQVITTGQIVRTPTRSQVGVFIFYRFCLLLTKQARTKISNDKLDHHGFPESTIFIAKFKTLNDLIKPPKNFWQNFLAEKEKHILLKSSKFACRGPEVGAPPIKTKKGWLLIYCGESKKREWTIDAALLDLNNPQKILWRSKDHLLKPEKSYEKNGIVSRVTFPEGAVIIGNKLYVYYGSADQGCCLATATLTN